MIDEIYFVPPARINGTNHPLTTVKKDLLIRAVNGHLTGGGNKIIGGFRMYNSYMAYGLQNGCVLCDRYSTHKQRLNILTGLIVHDDVMNLYTGDCGQHLKKA